jgi:hypothetical protein
MLRQPIPHGVGAMHPQPVEDQEHLATRIADQAPEEDDQHGRRDRAIERSSPLLLTAEITPTLALLWQGRTTGV